MAEEAPAPDPAPPAPPAPSASTDWSIHPKVGAGAAAGSAAGLVVWGLHQGLGWEIPPEVAVELSTVFAFAVSYMFPGGPK